MAGKVCCGEFCHVWVGFGEVGQVMAGMARCVMVRYGRFWLGSAGKAWSGGFCQVQVRFVAVRLGLAGEAWLV